ncbi:MAG: CHAP domain-containing protein [Betaproteobacteria bacterium]|nr:MAG: CHAP domain-containing protein [Betaproteobacteria bacterium]
MSNIYPGSPIKAGNSDRASIRAIQGALQQVGISGFARGQFDSAMTSAVKLFQSRNVDVSGAPLKIDGIVGRFTWMALFGVPPLIARGAISLLPAQLLSVACSQIGVMETPDEANRGPQVDKYLRTAGIRNPAGNQPAGYPWCQAFIYWCFEQAVSAIGRGNPSPRTAGVLAHWRDAPPTVARIFRTAALAQPTVVSAGQLMVFDYGTGLGHIAVVESVYADGRVVTVEGNTNVLADREGLGVYRLERRKLTDANLKGFLDYSAA